jgi:hypothetical protein
MKNEELIVKVEDFFGIPDKLRAKTRISEILRIRHCMFYFFTFELNMGCAEIGRLMNRDHATVINGRENVKNFKRFEPVYCDILSVIKSLYIGEEPKFNASLKLVKTPKYNLQDGYFN